MVIAPFTRMNKDEKRNTIGIISCLSPSIGADSDAKPQAEPLAAGSSDDCTNVSDSMPQGHYPQMATVMNLDPTRYQQ